MNRSFIMVIVVGFFSINPCFAGFKDFCRKVTLELLDHPENTSHLSFESNRGDPIYTGPRREDGYPVEPSTSMLWGGSEWEAYEEECRRLDRKAEELEKFQAKQREVAARKAYEASRHEEFLRDDDYNHSVASTIGNFLDRSFSATPSSQDKKYESPMFSWNPGRNRGNNR